MCTVSAENQVGVTIHQSGRDPSPRAVDPFGGIGTRWKVGTRASEDDAAIPRCDHTALNYARLGQIPPNGGKPGIVPDSIKALGHAAFSQQKLDGDIDMSIHIIVLVFCPPGLETCPLCISRQHCFPRGGLMTCRWL